MKQSKSAGQLCQCAQEEIEKYGADILRLWVASVNYQEDMRCSDELIGRLQDAYRKIRNTLRYLISNINDFVPKTDGGLRGYAHHRPLGDGKTSGADCRSPPGL
jgi:isoleucyl-tRNA synthetase